MPKWLTILLFLVPKASGHHLYLPHLAGEFHCLPPSEWVDRAAVRDWEVINGWDAWRCSFCDLSGRCRLHGWARTLRAGARLNSNCGLFKPEVFPSSYMSLCSKNCFGWMSVLLQGSCWEGSNPEVSYYLLQVKIVDFSALRLDNLGSLQSPAVSLWLQWTILDASCPLLDTRNSLLLTSLERAHSSCR